MGSIILTKQLLHAGTNKGVLNRKQCELLDIPFFNNREYKKALYGKEISEELYKEFCSLRITFGQRVNKIKTLKKLKSDILVRDYKSKSFDKLKATAKDNEVLENNLRSMKYSNFLKTRYWQTIREYMIRTADNKCSACGSTKKLNVHHKTYEHHGSEIFHLEDLVVLCATCHKKAHNLQ